MAPSLIFPSSINQGASHEAHLPNIIISLPPGSTWAPAKSGLHQGTSSADDKAKAFQESELELLFSLESLQAADSGAEGLTQSSEQMVLRHWWRLRCKIARDNYKDALWEREFEPVLQEGWLKAGPRLKAENGRLQMVQAEGNPSQLHAGGPKQSSKRSTNAPILSNSSMTDADDPQNTVDPKLRETEVSVAGMEEILLDSCWHFLEDKLKTYKSQYEEALAETLKLLPLVNEKEQGFAAQTVRFNGILESCAILCARIDRDQSMTDRDLAAAHKPFATTVQLRTDATADLLMVSNMRTENAEFRASRACQRVILDHQFSQAQAENETALASAAELLIEAPALHIQTDQIRAATDVELEATTNIRAEIAHLCARQTIRS